MTRLLIYMCPIWGPTCTCRQHQNSTIYQYEFRSGVASVLSESTNARTVLCESTTPPQPYFWKVRPNIKIVLSESTNSYFPEVRFGLKSYSWRVRFGRKSYFRRVRFWPNSYFRKVRIRTFGKYGTVLSESTNYIEKVWSRVEKQKRTYSINIFGLLIFFAIYISRNYIWRPALPVENAI